MGRRRKTRLGSDLVISQWSVVSGQWSVVSGQLSVVSGQWSLVIRPISPSPHLPCSPAPLLLTPPLVQ